MKAFFLSGFLIFCCVFSYGQQVIRGIVVDSASYSALPNVNVQIKNRYRGTTTDSKGNFTLYGTPNDTLVLSLVGYNRLALPLYDYEVSMIRMSQKETMLAPIIINDSRLYVNPYEGMFDDQDQNLKKRIPFYYSKGRKDKIKAANWREESARVQTYIDVVINNAETKNGLLRKHGLNENEYYAILTAFNEKHYAVMYYLTAGELISLINKFFEAAAPSR